MMRSMYIRREQFNEAIAHMLEGTNKCAHLYSSQYDEYCDSYLNAIMVSGFDRFCDENPSVLWGGQHLQVRNKLN